MSQFGGGPPDQEKLKQHLEEWLAKLVGKKIVDTAVAEDNAVSYKFLRLFRSRRTNRL